MDGSYPYDPSIKPDMYIADVDGDDDLNILDATIIQRYVAGIIEDLEAYRNSQS